MPTKRLAHQVTRHLPASGQAHHQDRHRQGRGHPQPGTLPAFALARLVHMSACRRAGPRDGPPPPARPRPLAQDSVSVPRVPKTHRQPAQGIQPPLRDALREAIPLLYTTRPWLASVVPPSPLVPLPAMAAWVMSPQAGHEKLCPGDSVITGRLGKLSYATALRLPTLAELLLVLHLMPTEYMDDALAVYEIETKAFGSRHWPRHNARLARCGLCPAQRPRALAGRVGTEAPSMPRTNTGRRKRPAPPRQYAARSRCVKARHPRPSDPPPRGWSPCASAHSPRRRR